MSSTLPEDNVIEFQNFVVFATWYKISIIKKRQKVGRANLVFE